MTQEISKSKVEAQFPFEFNILKEYGQLVNGWENAYNHCKTECAAALVISDLINLDSEKRNILAKAAILHDWYKRKEKESGIEGSDKYEKGVIDSYEGLLKLGVDKQIVDIAHNVGHTSLLDIQVTTDILKKIMHFIDDITFESDIVELDVRIDANEANEQYKELNESGRAKHNGRTYFEVQREVGHKIQDEIEKTIIDVKSNVELKKGELVYIIKNNIGKYL